MAVGGVSAVTSRAPAGMKPRPLDPDVRLLAALVDPIRLDILRELACDGEVCGCGFRVLDRVSQPTVSHHLRILREAGLVHFTRERSYLRYHLDPDVLAHVAAVVDALRLVRAKSSAGDTVEGTTLGCCGR